MAKFIPKRRDRKLHTGLFGYARSLDGVSLPRAISFTASLYSLGMPPELLGLSAFTKTTYNRAREIYEFFEEDLAAARDLVASTGEAELFLYPGEEHLFADSSLPAYDAAAAALLTERVLAFLASA
jgi:phosphoenolpyruvate carboxylase